MSRFQREAEDLASLNHPNIAAIYDLQEAQGSRYLVLELVEGVTLADRIDQFRSKKRFEIAKSICEALEAAHEKGIIRAISGYSTFPASFFSSSAALS